MAIMPSLGERVLELQGAIKTVRRGVLPLMQQRPAEPPGALQLDPADDDPRSTGCRTPKRPALHLVPGQPSTRHQNSITASSRAPRRP